MDKAPNFLLKKLPSGATLVRFSCLQDIYYYDSHETNPRGLGWLHNGEERIGTQEYFRDRGILTPSKQKIITRAQKEMSIDKDFLDLVYKAKSQKRKFELNKFVGNLSMPDYASQSEKIFRKSQPGAKKQTLNMAFQVGTFVGGNYTESFIGILKTIMMCQAMNINVNIDMFDSDTDAIGFHASYVIANVAKSAEKLDYKRILAASHDRFFSTTLFNGYSASGCQKSIGTFLSQSRILEDLAPMYDVIGGNMLLTEDNNTTEGKELVSKILKIGLKR